MFDPMEKGRKRLEGVQNGSEEDPGFWGRVAYFKDDSIDPYQEDVELYDLIRYGSTGGMNVFERQASNYEKALEELGASSGDTVMELGGGTSRFSERLSDQGYETFSVDVSAEAQSLARELGRSDHQVLGDATELPFEDDSVDYIVAPRVYHLVDDEQMIEEMDRVAEQGLIFDYFREGSLKDQQVEFMDAMDSNVHSDEQIMETVNEISGEEFGLETDFGLPYAFEIPWNDETISEVARKIQSFAGREKIPVENTVGYISAETR